MRFFVGDENGQLKSVRCTKLLDTDWKLDVSLLDNGGMQGKVKNIQRLAVRDSKIVVARGDGSGSLFDIDEDPDSARVLQQWGESRLLAGEKFVGLSLRADGQVLSCTEAGHLRLTHPPVVGDTITSSQTTTIPNRLCDWALSFDSEKFAYGGEEVEISLWDISRAFDPSRKITVGTKRKRGQKFDLLDGEIWRAKNVPNDSLNLRQPVHNTSLTFLSPTPGNAGPTHHILAGSRIGSVRRYDTRVARKPVADWKDVGKVGGIKKVAGGNLEHEAYIADHGSGLMALDLRTGRILYSYQGFAGAVSSISPTSSSLSPPLLLASTALDRFFRLHSTHDPGYQSTGQTGGAGEVVAKVWLKTCPSCMVWDGQVPKPLKDDAFDRQEDANDVWARMEKADDGDDRFTDSSVSDDKNCQRKREKMKAP